MFAQTPTATGHSRIDTMGQRPESMLMPTMIVPRTLSRRDSTGFFVSSGFVCLASVRDIYLGGVFQQVSPPFVAILAFILGSAVFLPIGFVHARQSFPILCKQWRILFWVNVSTASAWIAFLYAPKLIEPSIVQILAQHDNGVAVSSHHGAKRTCH